MCVSDGHNGHNNENTRTPLRSSPKRATLGNGTAWSTISANYAQNEFKSDKRQVYKQSRAAVGGHEAAEGAAKARRKMRARRQATGVGVAAGGAAGAGYNSKSGGGRGDCPHGVSFAFLSWRGESNLDPSSLAAVRALAAAVLGCPLPIFAQKPPRRRQCSRARVAAPAAGVPTGGPCAPCMRGGATARPSESTAARRADRAERCKRPLA